MAMATLQHWALEQCTGRDTQRAHGKPDPNNLHNELQG